MTTISTASLGAGTPGALTQTTASATQSLLAQNPGIRNIDAQLGRDGARLSVIGKLALALDEFRNSAAKLAGDRLDAAASVTGDALTARITDGKTATGTHTVEVKLLAQGQQLQTGSVPDKAAALGTGAPTLVKIESGSGAGGKSATLRIDAANNTLDGIAKAMRDAGFDAKIVQDGKGYALSLTGATGAANSMRISVAGDAALGALLSYGPDADAAMSQKQAAGDARVVVDGKALTTSTNTLEAAIPGMALNLVKTGTSEVGVKRDPSAMAANVKELVGAYNTLGGKLAGLKTGDAANDAMVARIGGQLGNVLDGAAQRTLAGLGITRRDGQLVLDEARLNAAIAAEPAQLASMFGAPGTGLAEQFTARVGQQLASGGMLADQAAALQGHVDQLTAQKTQVSATLQRQASMLAQQYATGGTGGSSLFGMSTGTPTSLFDILG